VKLGIIDPYYTTGPARVLFDGETVISSRGYSWVPPYSPVSGERVFLIPVGQTYLIGGSIASSVTYATYHDISMNTSGGWGLYSSTFHNPSFTKTLGGVVKLTGLAANTNTGAIASGSVIGYLPEGFWPLKDMDFPAMSGLNATGVVTVTDDGRVITRKNITGSWVSLGNITYQTSDLTWTEPTMLNGWTGSYLFPYTRKVAYAKDSTGRTFLTGTFGDPTPATPPASDSVFMNFPSGYRSAWQYYGVGASLTGSGDGFTHFFQNNGTGDFSWRTGSSYPQDISVDGVIFPPSDASWATPTMMGTWVTFGPNNTPGYYKDSDGLVHLRGLVKSGTINTAIFTLPTGFKPSKNIVRNTVSNLGPARLDVRSDGLVMPVTGSNVWFSLDGVVFTPEA
jgi:hypothetical protein